MGRDVVSIPPGDDPDFPNGFPRHGDNETVDPAGYGVLDTTDYTYGSGPQQRLVVEMSPEGPHIWNALPGGQSIDPESPHHADEMELWRRNEAPPVYMDEPKLLLHGERRVRFVP
jgi:penicillin amidase